MRAPSFWWMGVDQMMELDAPLNLNIAEPRSFAEPHCMR